MAAPSQPAAVDAVQMLLVDGLLEGLAGPLAGQDPQQPLAGLSVAVEALQFLRLHLQDATAQAPVFVPHRPVVQPLAVHASRPAVRAEFRPGIPGRNSDDSLLLLNLGNLEVGQAQQDLG